MSIKATVDGVAYNSITTIDAGGKVVSLAEVGTITTPTQTLTKDITSNGSITLDVTNYKSITINTNVQSESGGDTPVEPPIDEPTSANRNLFNPNLAQDGKTYNRSSGTGVFSVWENSDYLCGLVYLREGHQYKGLTRQGYTNLNYDNTHSYYVQLSDTNNIVIPDSLTSDGAKPTVPNGYIFQNKIDNYFESSKDSWLLISIMKKGNNLSLEDIMIYDLTENGLLTTFEEWSD